MPVYELHHQMMERYCMQTALTHYTNVTILIIWPFIIQLFIAVPFIWQHGDCSEVKREYYQNCFILPTCYIFIRYN